jgi:Icc-related predicted phosphoesterase
MARGFERILFISDLHAPYQHPDTLAYLEAVKAKYKPDRVVIGGDEADHHAMSYHESDPDLPSAGQELVATRKALQGIHKLFPVADVLDSNHGSLYYRKAKTHGIPRAALVDYQTLLGLGGGWRWHMDLTVRMSNGQSVYCHHGKSANVTALSKNMGLSAVQFHYHSLYKVEFWGNPGGLYWGMQCGCMIDDDALAFAYNKNTLGRPIIGCGIALDGYPHLLPLVKRRDGRWNGKVY